MPQFSPDQCSFGDVAGYGAWDISHGREHIQFIQVLAVGFSIPASVSATVGAGAVTGFTGLSGGAGYIASPIVSFSGGGGSGAAAHAIISNGSVTAIILDAGGAGYASPPTVILTAQNMTLPDPDLLSLLTAGNARSSQVQSHYTQHQLLRQALGVQGVDLTQVNLDDPNDFYSFLGYHATEHQEMRLALGLV